MTFMTYIRMRRHEHSPVGSLARDMLFDRDQCPIHDFTRPCDHADPASLSELVFLLEEHCACDAAMNAAARAWADYIRWKGAETDFTRVAA